MKDLPDTEKPYEKFLSKGAGYLSDAELLAVILRTGSHGTNSTELAQELLKLSPGGILNISHLNYQDFLCIPGIGQVKAIQLKCLAEISKRMAMSDKKEQIALKSAESVASYYMEEMRHAKRENLMLCMFDSKCKLIRDEVISVGTMTASLVSPGEIFHSALSNRASYIILLHNHPSGDPTPSKEDQRVTVRIAECGNLLGIQLADHIIIGDHKYYSFNEKGLLTVRPKGEIK
ncbi:MAG: RadC family protein [Lachnospiraceae bacterium]